MRLSRGTSLDERRQCLDHQRAPNSNTDKHFDNSSNNTFERHLPDNPNIEKKKQHSGDRRVKSKSDRHSFYSERENSNPVTKANDFSDKNNYNPHKRGDLYNNEENLAIDRLSYYNENDHPIKIANSFAEHECKIVTVREEVGNEKHIFFAENDLQAENRMRRENAKSIFFEKEIAESVVSDGRNLYGDHENDPQGDCKFLDKNEHPMKIENESIIQTRRAYFGDNENRKSFGEVEMRRNKSGNLRQELRGQRSTFSESIDSASSRSQISGHEAATDFAEKMLKSSRTFLTEDCCRLNTASSARETSDDNSPGALSLATGFETIDTKYARKRAKKGHRRQKSLDISRHTAQPDVSQSEAKSFRDFELEEDLSKRLDRLEPKPSGFIRKNLKKNLSRYDLNFDSEDERCFRLSLDMERSFDLDFLDTSIDDRYDSYDRDFDLV